MNIWKWVNDTKKELRAAGNSRLADLVDEIASNVYNDRIALAQAALPEALAGARAINHPWLEVYFRHWVMNGRVAQYEEGESALRETVDLFEFAHREETINCPQSICVTQDIALCYGSVDGPGYAAERIAVCEETLARINPAWACFSCISTELVSALADGGRAPEAMKRAERQIVLMKEEGRTISVAMRRRMARTLYVMNEFDRALALLDEIEAQNDDETELELFDHAALRFRILAAQGNYKEALDVLPDAPEGTLRDNYDIAAGLGMVLTAMPELNDFVAGCRLMNALRRYCASGAHRHVMDVLNDLVRLAVARGARWTAQEAMRMARPHLDKLRAPLGAPEQFAELETLVAAMPLVRELPVPVDELLDYLDREGDNDPEGDLEYLLLAASQRPDDAKIAAAISRAMQACGAKAQ